MKKIIAIIAVFAVLFSLSACKMKQKDLSDDEIQSYLSAEESKQVEQSLKVERDYIEGVDEQVDDKIGKTKKNKKLVVEVSTTAGYEYIVFEFSGKGILKKKLSYYFYNDVETYRFVAEHGGGSDKEIVDTDDKARMVVYNYKNLPEKDYDGLYETYSLDTAAEMGYRIIE